MTGIGYGVKFRSNGQSGTHCIRVERSGQDAVVVGPPELYRHAHRRQARTIEGKPNAGAATTIALMRASLILGHVPVTGRGWDFRSVQTKKAGCSAQWLASRVMSGLPPAAARTVNPPAEKPKAPIRFGSIGA